jgi:hypothetical protein
VTIWEGDSFEFLRGIDLKDRCHVWALRKLSQFVLDRLERHDALALTLRGQYGDIMRELAKHAGETGKCDRTAPAVLRRIIAERDTSNRVVKDVSRRAAQRVQSQVATPPVVVRPNRFGDGADSGAMLCDHANEVPCACACPCDVGCYCKLHACKT